MKTLLTLFVSALVVVFVGALGIALDDMDSARTEWATAQSLNDAQADAVRAQHRDLAAAKLCRLQHGEASFTWTAADQLVCIPRRGRQVIAEVSP